ncbi:hypothetical protein GGQ61_003612 [Phenylobacterium haematophilum]|jgi:hypothetical protein|uniref:Uncharacterized protein n=1 Tax=Phenylobacterium haematophilum TaxID=98513 RepID=A0A840A3I4_9CAUL|nr:hypothetical protein [Phenylobacterium haematophilum]MBB3892874.1 hypothetical protein [Phenylobacterium haematophilum]
MNGPTSTTRRARFGRIWRRARELLLAVPMLMVGVTVADILADPEQPGPLTWWALGVAGAAIVLYLAFPGGGEDRT